MLVVEEKGEGGGQGEKEDQGGGPGVGPNKFELGGVAGSDPNTLTPHISHLPQI